MATAAIEQIQGCLLGLAVADAVGAPWEGMPPDLVFEMGPAAEIVKHESGRKLHYTDDTQMMMGIAEGLLEAGTIDVEVLAHRFAANYNPNRGYGQGTRQIINAIGFGEDWRTLAKTIFDGEGSLGNGAAMRVAPLGVVFADSLDEVVAQARRSAEPTHTHPIGVDSAAVMAVAAALAVRDANSAFDRHGFFESLLPHAQTETGSSSRSCLMPKRKNFSGRFDMLSNWSRSNHLSRLAIRCRHTSRS
jgi:poly(ADP-ribose) glycohydrolase ARH3